jgi:hypothetical protein
MDDLDRHLHRWLDADAADGDGVDERDDEADASFRVVYGSTMNDPVVRADFAAATMAAVEAAAAQDRKAARLTRVAAIWLGIGGGALATYFSAGLIASAISTAFTGLLDMVIGAIVGAATTGGSGTSVWSILGSLGRAAAAFASSPIVTITILTMQAIAIAALVALQRMLGSDME